MKRFGKIISRIVLGISILFWALLLISEISGDGYGFSALIGTYKSERFLSLLEKGKYEKAANYVSFSGDNEDVMRDLWVSEMNKLNEEDGIAIIGHSDIHIATDDRFTSGEALVSVKYDNEIYDFRLSIFPYKTKLAIGHLIGKDSFGRWDYTRSEKGSDIETMLIDEISDVLSTYDPG